MKLKLRNKKPVIVPFFSTSDIAFLLLIFIMLLALMNYRKEVKINFPEANTALNTNARKNLEVWVDINGKIYVNGDPANIVSLEYSIINLYRSGEEDTRIHIIADRNTPYHRINDILELLQVLQYRVVSFVVKNVE